MRSNWRNVHLENITLGAVWRKGGEEISQEQARPEMRGLVRKVMMRWGKVYRFKKNM